MRIILVRHAKAEDGGGNLFDFDRQLTDEGRQRFRDLLPSLVQTLEETGSWKSLIWSSPAARARQTADLLAEVLPDARMELHDFIYEGDFQAFQQELKYVEEKQILFVVGHEPDLSDWLLRISGNYVNVKKGDMLGVQLWSRTPLRGRLIFHLSGRPVASSEPPAELTWAVYKKTILSRIDCIQERLMAFREDSADPETLHQLRVSIRTARSLLSFARPVFPFEDYRFYQDKLRTMGGRFGYVREIDVLLEQYLASGGEVAGALATAYGKLRVQEAAKAIRYGMSVSIPNDLEDVSSWLESFSVVEGFAAFAEERFERWNQRVAKKIRKVDFTDWKKTHPIRILYKKIRYVQRAFPQLEAQASLDLASLKEMQDDLGMICDTHRNVDLLISGQMQSTIWGMTYEGVYLGDEASDFAKEEERAERFFFGPEFQAEAEAFIDRQLKIREERVAHLLSTKLDQDQRQ